MVKRRNVEESPEWWCALIEAARADQDAKVGRVRTAVEEAYTGRVGRFQTEYGGVQINSNGRPSQKNIRPPRMYALTHGMEATLFFNRPKFFVRPYVGRLETLAQDLERLAAVMWPRFVGDKELRWIIRDTIKTGRGWGLIGFDFDEDEERSILNERRALSKKLKESVFRETLTPEAIVQTEAPPEVQMDNEVEPENLYGDSRSRSRRPSFRRLSPGDVTYDPGACNIYDAKWIDYRSFVDMDSLLADPFFKGAKDVKPCGKMEGGKWRSVMGQHVVESPSEYPASGGMTAGSYAYAELHYTAVKRPDGSWDVLQYASGQKKFGRVLRAPYWFGCPFISLAWNDDGDSMDVVSDAERLLGGIVEEAALRTRLKDHWNRKPNDVIAADERVFQNTGNKAAIEVQRTATFLPMRNPSEMANIPLSNYLFPIPRNANISEVYQQLQLIAKDFEAVTGLGANQQLQALKSETSSFEAQEIARNARSRGIEKQESVEFFCATLAHRMLMLAAQFFNANRAAEYISGDAVSRWKTYDFQPGDVQDNLGVEVERGSMRPQSDDGRKQLYLMLLQSGLSNPAFAAKFNLEEVVKRLMEVDGILDGSKLMNGSVDMNQMVAAMMQMQLAGAGGAAPAPPQQGGATTV